MAFIHQKPFLNPRVPFKGCIEGGLLEGKVITVTGRVMPAADRFHVNMQCGLGQLGDTAFHFTPRYERLPGYVVCNTMQNYIWGKEERKYEAPIPRGANFTLTLLVNRDTYSVIINGSHFLDYCHRLPISCVDTISVDGGVEINSISFQNPPHFHTFGEMAFIHQKPFLNPRVPFKGCIEGGLLEGKVITVTGRVMPAADRFHVNMQCGLGQLGDTAFHFTPRYERLPGYVVCNTMQNYIWGKEERKYEAPIPRGANFTLTLLVNRDTYSVIINGSHFLDYCHRLPISCVDTISVDGGVEINSISFQNPPGLVVRNSFLNERWGHEERTGGLPFYPGQSFLVTLTCDTECYRVLLSGIQIFTYQHRHKPLQEVDILEVTGDVTLTSVLF